MLTYNTIWAAVVLASARTATAVELTPYNLVNDSDLFQEFSLGLYRLECTSGGWSGDHFCQAVTKQPVVLSNSYVISVKMFDDDGILGTTRLGHPTIIFNWHDENNYDFVYVRALTQDMLTGHVLDAVATWSDAIDLPVTVNFDKWFNYKIICTSTGAGPVTVTFYVNDIPCSSWTAHFPNNMYAGFGALQGYKNVVWAKDFQVTELDF